MSVNRTTLPSAVILPDAEKPSLTPISSVKRRRSSLSNDENKRARIELVPAPVVNSAASQPGPPEVRPKATGQDSEERKRGKRLFGALIGALNQNSSSAAQRRRGDIDRKQQEKLKLETREYREQQSKQREELLSARRQEQAIYLKEAARTRQAHTSTCARFLQTIAEPRLFYKPWKLLRQQQVRIDKQITEAQGSPDQRMTHLNDDPAAAAGNIDDDAEHIDSEMRATQQAKPGGNGGAGGDEGSHKDPRAKGDNRGADSPRLSEEVMDEGGEESVDGDEDDVLY